MHGCARACIEVAVDLFLALDGALVVEDGLLVLLVGGKVAGDALQNVAAARQLQAHDRITHLLVQGFGLLEVAALQVLGSQAQRVGRVRKSLVRSVWRKK